MKTLPQVSAWRIVVAASVATVAVVVAWLGGMRLLLPADRMSLDSLAEQAMPDRTVLVLEQIRTGDSHKLEIRSPPSTFFEWLTGSTPIAYGGQIRVPVKDSLTLFFSRRDPGSRAFLDFDWWSHCAVVGDDGREHRDLGNGGSVSVGGGDPGAAAAGRKMVISFANVPRVRHAGGSFTVRAYDNQQRVVAKLEVPHPGGESPPIWQPDSLPVTRENDAVSVTLNGIKAELVEHAFSTGLTLEQRYLVPDLQIEESVTETVDRRRCRVSGSDALGNTIEPVDYWLKAAHDQPAIECSPLNSEETAWRLQVTLLPGPSQVFEPDQQTTISGVEVPAPGEMTLLHRPYAVNGELVELLSIGGKGVVRHEFKETPDGAHVSEAHGDVVGGRYDIKSEYGGRGTIVTVSSPCPHVILRADNLPDDCEVLLRALDERGRNVAVEHDRALGLAFWFLQTESDVRQVDLTIVVYQPRRFDFRIHPPIRGDSAKTQKIAPGR